MSTKKTRKRALLVRVINDLPWCELVGAVEPHLPKSKMGRPPFTTEIMLRIHCLQHWFTLGISALDEALHDMPLYRGFA